MLLNKNNLDVCYSLPIGTDREKNPLKIRIDKLTLVSRFVDQKEKKETYSRIVEMRRKVHACYSIKHIKNKEDMPYRTALLIKERSKGTPVLLRIDYSPINHSTGGIRLDFYPQYLCSRKIDQLLLWVKNQLGEIFYQLLARSWITRIDIAVDIYSRDLHNYLWGLKRAGKTKYFNEHNGFPGIQLGSGRSKLHMLCYEKLDAYGNENIKMNKRSEFISINVDEHKKFLRIESRYRPNSKPGSKNGGPLMLSNLLKMENPLRRLNIYSNDLLHELLNKGYIYSVPAEPSISALNCFIKRDMNVSRMPREILRIFEKHKASVFDKDKVWEKWPDYTKQLSRIFTIAVLYKDSDEGGLM